MHLHAYALIMFTRLLDVFVCIGQGISQANAKQADKLEELTKKLQHKESKLTSMWYSSDWLKDNAVVVTILICRLVCPTSPEFYQVWIDAVAESRYSEEEEQQYNKLVVLIKDAVYLRVFIKTALAQIAQVATEFSIENLSSADCEVATHGCPLSQRCLAMSLKASSLICRL